MRYCANCGQPIDPQAVICPHCGTPIVTVAPAHQSGSAGWGLLGFLFPLVGLILFLVWQDDRPRSAKAAGIGALIGVGSILALAILLILLLFLIAYLSGLAH